MLGNHDIHYLWNGIVEESSRFSDKYANPIIKLFRENSQLFKIAHEEFINDKIYLFSHAGVTKTWLCYNDITLEEGCSIETILTDLTKTTEVRRD